MRTYNFSIFAFTLCYILIDIVLLHEINILGIFNQYLKHPFKFTLVRKLLINKKLFNRSKRSF